MKNDYVNLIGIMEAFESFKSAMPFNFCFVKEFFKFSIADYLESEFLDYSSDKWFVHNNEVINKNILNEWNIYLKNTYSLFSYLNSSEFVDFLSFLFKKKLYCDPSLYGGGWHIHGAGGNLNPHLDYSVHPKLKLQRTLNTIMYVSGDLLPSHGGHLGLWSHNEAQLPLGVDP